MMIYSSVVVSISERSKSLRNENGVLKSLLPNETLSFVALA